MGLNQHSTTANCPPLPIPMSSMADTERLGLKSKRKTLVLPIATSHILRLWSQ